MVPAFFFNQLPTFISMKIEDNFYPSCNFNATRGRMLHKKLVMRFHVKLPQISLIGCLCLFYTIFFFKIDLIQWSLKYSRHLHLLVLRRMSKSSTNTLKSWEFGWYCFDANLIVSSTWCKVIDTWLSLQRPGLCSYAGTPILIIF